MNPCFSTGRAKLIYRLCLKGKTRKQAETIAVDIESGFLKVSSLEDKIARRHANVIDPTHWKACDGEAHSNAYIDHCGVCAPNWGKVWKD